MAQLLRRAPRRGVAWRSRVGASSAAAGALATCRTDPNVPPLPPELTAKQKDKLREALASDPERDAALAQLDASGRLR